MLTLPTNYSNFIARLFFLAGTFFIGFLLVNFGLKDTSNEHIIFQITAIGFKFKATYLLYFVIAVMGFLAFTIIASLLSINKVQIDRTIDSITFTGLISKYSIASSDISEYFETFHRNAFKGWEGLLIKTTDKKTIQVTGQNIQSLSDLKDYLNEKKIFYSGQKKMKFPFN